MGIATSAALTVKLLKSVFERSDSFIFSTSFQIGVTMTIPHVATRSARRFWAQAGRRLFAKGPKFVARTLAIFFSSIRRVDPNPWATHRISTSNSHPNYKGIGRTEQKSGTSGTNVAFPTGIRRRNRGRPRVTSPVTAASSRMPLIKAAISPLETTLVTTRDGATITITLPDSTLEIRSSKLPPAGAKTALLPSDDVAEELQTTGPSTATPQE